MTSIIESNYIPPDRPYSQAELCDTRDKLYKSLRLGTTKACHSHCQHFYFVRQNGRKEKDILESDSQDVGNCSVCWKINKTKRSHKQKATNLVQQYSNTFYDPPQFLTYNGVDLETIYYKWLYEEPEGGDHTNGGGGPPRRNTRRQDS